MASKRLHFSIDIPASNDAIWKSLWSDQGYNDWASIFFEGSYLLATTWNANGTVHFLSPDKSGIYSNIESHVPNESILFKHIGTLKEGKEQPVDHDSKSWTGSLEKYSLSKIAGGFTLNVDIDVLDEHLEFMQKTFPIALEVIKKNAVEA